MRAPIEPAHHRRSGGGIADRSDAVEMDVLGPVLAGMRARAIADTCDALSLPSIFVDRSGRLLHVGALASPFLGAAVAVEAEHLIGRSERVNDQLQALLSEALGRAVGEIARSSVVIEGDTPGAAMSITAQSCGDPSPYQLLKAILVFSRDVEQPAAGVASLEACLRS